MYTMESVYFCPQCHEKFTSDIKYRNHVIDKLICYRCLKQYKTVKGLSMHINPKRSVKCKDMRALFAESVKNKQHGESIKQIKSETEENKNETEQLKQEVEELKKTVRFYKNRALDTLEHVFDTSKTDDESKSIPNETNAIAIRSKYNLTSETCFSSTGYTSDAYIPLLYGNNEDKLLSEEFDYEEINHVDEQSANIEYQRKDHSNNPQGFISNKFNNNLAYDQRDLDDIENQIIFGKGDFNERIILNNSAIGDRRRKHNQNSLDIDYDFYRLTEMNNLRIEH